MLRNPAEGLGQPAPHRITFSEIAEQYRQHALGLADRPQTARERRTQAPEKYDGVVEDAVTITFIVKAVLALFRIG